MVSRIYVAFEIRFIQTFLAANLLSKALFLRIYYLMPWPLPKFTRAITKVSRERLNYIFCKWFYKALDTT